MVLFIGLNVIPSIALASDMKEPVIMTGFFPESTKEISNSIADPTSSIPAPISRNYQKPTIFYEDAEGIFPGLKWNVKDMNLDNGTDYWGNCSNRTGAGNLSIYCAGIGDTGVGGQYENNMSSWMYIDVFDASKFISMSLSFDLWFETEPGVDFVSVVISNNNGKSWTNISEFYNGSSNGWVNKIVPISSNYFTSGFSVGFHFYSDDANSSFEGVYLDEVRLTAIQYTIWTVIVYLAADHNLAPWMLKDYYNMLFADAITNFQVVVLYDGDEYGDSWIRHFVADFVIEIPLTDINPTWGSELDTGDHKTLTDFVKYSISTHPSDRIYLSIDDHGSSFHGCCWDLTDHSWLTMDALNNSLTEIMAYNGDSKVEILQYYACEMASMEVLYLSYPYAEYTIASEITVYALLWNYSRIFNHIEANPSIIGSSLSSFVVNDSIQYYPKGYSSAMSAIDNSNMPPLISALNNFSSKLIDRLLRYYPYLWMDRNMTEWYEAPRHPDIDQKIDLYHFVENINDDINLPFDLRFSANKLMSIIDDTVIAESHNSGHFGDQRPADNAHGISIYLPGHHNFANYIYYNEYDNAFSRNTKWLKFIKRFVYLSMWDDFESDDTYQSCTEIPTNNTPQWHSLVSMYDVDWIQFFAKKGFIYSIETLNLTFHTNTKISLYDKTGENLLEYNDDTPKSLSSKIVWECPEDGNYYIKVESSGIGFGSQCWYDIQVGKTSPKLSVSITELNFSYLGESGNNSKYFNIRNTGLGSLYWTITTKSSWLQVNKASGCISNSEDIKGNDDTIEVKILLNSLEDKFHSGILEVYSNVGRANIFVNTTIDTTLPTLSFLGLVDGIWLNETSIQVQWSAIDTGSGIKHYEIQLDNRSWVDTGLATMHFFKNLDEGFHSINLTAIDNVSNLQYVSTNFNIDITPPKLEINHPLPDSVFSSDIVEAEWTGSDLGSGIDHYEIKLDDKEVMDVSDETSYTFNGLGTGTHTITIFLIDNVGFTTGGNVTFFVDSMPPELTIVTPQAEDWINTAEVQVEWNASDIGTGVEYIKIILDNAQEFIIPGENTSCNLVGLCEGKHKLGITAFDKVNNSVAEKVVFYFDCTNPTLTVSKPEEKSVLETSNVICSWAGIDDGSGVDYYMVSLDRGGYINTGKDTRYTFHDVGAGEHVLRVVAVDHANNSKKIMVEFSVKMVDDGSSGDRSGNLMVLITVILVIVIILVIGLLFFLKSRNASEETLEPEKILDVDVPIPESIDQRPGALDDQPEYVSTLYFESPVPIVPAELEPIEQSQPEPQLPDGQLTMEGTDGILYNEDSEQL
jgi:hypothetical protein